MQVVWFKRDLRVQDNRALVRAAACGATLPLFVVEPGLWQQADMSARHWAFLSETLVALREALADCGQPLIIRTGDVVDILEGITTCHPISALWSHEETGNDWTYLRDQRVAAWCRSRGIVWHELQNHGVQRRLGSRNGWAKAWDLQMAEPAVAVPRLRPLPLEPGPLPSARDLGLAPDGCDGRQSGGRKAATDLLETFLTRRGETYQTAMSSPLQGAQTCSRLSPHLAWGSLSMREAAQATWARQRTLKTQPHDSTTRWRGALSSFSSRLHWHCHFIQKLEDEPRIEFENLHRGYDGIRPSAPDQARLNAWARGETGLPFVDACMRSLAATGWLNFRMRAMVMATASYHLWLDWRAPGLELARLFTDYEPGIHWSQVQMQSGTTGINTIRIYNPVKQGHDQDPTGDFTRFWLPELADIPDQFLQEPWKAENAGAVLGKRYPVPLVDHMSAARHAREKVWAIRSTHSFRTGAAEIQTKHGSRKSGIKHRGRNAGKQEPRQLSFPF
ncbi:MAG: deoxyribodipyrimidine photo-lyase [Paracoccaceae bacterium]